MTKRKVKKKKSKVEIELSKYTNIYKRWDFVYCPALKSNVYFTKKGWIHLFEEKKDQKIKQ